MSLVDEVRTARSLPPPLIAKAIREAAHVSQGRLADELHVHRVTVARWEQGVRHPRGEVRVRYAALLRQLEREIA